MGWRGTLRSLAAAQRAAERAAVRHQRQLEKQIKAQAKLDALQQAIHEVELYENWVARITTMHQTCGPYYDWQGIIQSPPPATPIPTSKNETAARHSLETYSPSFFDRVFHRIEKRRRTFTTAIETSRQADQAENARAIAVYKSQYTEWQEMHSLAQQVLAGDAKSLHDVLEELSPLRELQELGSQITVSFPEKDQADVTFHVHGERVIPSESKTLLQSGKLSIKKVPQTRFYEIYQDYVAGSVLRIARELFAILPLDSVTITAVGEMLDTSSGHLITQPILSVFIPYSTLATFNFDALDPSDALKNLKHHMDFKKTKGFAPIDPLHL